MDHVRTVNQMIEKYYEYNLPSCLAFIDFKKAFNDDDNFLKLSRVSGCTEYPDAQNISPAYLKMLGHVFRLGTSSMKLHTHTNKIRWKKETVRSKDVIHQGDFCEQVVFEANCGTSVENMTVMSQLVVPITLWGRIAPTHCISSVYLTKDQKTIVTGCYDGQICLWDVDEHFKVMPRSMLFGHSAPVLCLTEGCHNAESHYLVSSSENGGSKIADSESEGVISNSDDDIGNLLSESQSHRKPTSILASGDDSDFSHVEMELDSEELFESDKSDYDGDDDDEIHDHCLSCEMSLWDISDGRCIENTKTHYTHTNIQAYTMLGTSEVRLFCNGYYAEIAVIDAFTLDLIFSLTSRVNSDWLSAMHILRPVKRDDDVVLALSTSGHVKIWTLNGSESKNSEPIFENESKPISCYAALSLTCCPYNQRTVLIVCTKSWQIFDAGDFAVLCTVHSRRWERWSGGQFLSSDRVIVWSDSGKGYLYKLPNNCVVESPVFHTKSKANDQPFLYCILNSPMNDKKLSCPPAMRHCFTSKDQYNQVLIRGDSSGRLMIWTIPSVKSEEILKLQQIDNQKLEIPPHISFSLQEAWDSMTPLPPGILDQMDTEESNGPKLTSSIFLPIQGRLVCGREDGSIMIVPATQTILLQLLSGKHHASPDWPPHQVLHGHNGRVNCLLYPHNVHNRYDIRHLVSGGADFCVCLWDIYAGTLLHTFCVQAGEITQLTVPPNNCNSRILQCVCSVASDHSVALLGLKERKCVMLASRHLFPVQIIKWRPPDDFMIVGCSDGSVSVWQLETGHLDRVVQGLPAEEILNACDENIVSSGDKMTNPALHLFRGLRHRNLNAIRQAAQRGLHNLQNLSNQQNMGSSDAQKSRAHPLMIQGLRTNPKDQESHVLFFDIEALIVQLLTEEYSAMSPGTLEAHGLINQSEYQKVASLTQSSVPGTKHKLVEVFTKVKDHAETAAHKIQARAEIAGFKQNEGLSIRKDSNPENNHQKPKQLMMVETNLTMEIAQLLLSLLHAWGLDSDLDKVCESHMSLLLPTYRYNEKTKLNIATEVDEIKRADSTKKVKLSTLPPELYELAKRTQEFTSRQHWELSTAVTTHHLLSLVSSANTLMSMNNATFIPEQEKKRKLNRRLSRADSKASGKSGDISDEQAADIYANEQAQIKQGWSLFAALNCVLLPDLIKSTCFKRLQVRDASQALLLAELKRVGPKGRKTIVDEWSPYLPNYSEQYPGTIQSNNVQNPVTISQGNIEEHNFQSAAVIQKTDINSTTNDKTNGDSENTAEEEQEEEYDEEEDSPGSTRKLSSVVEAKRKQSTAIVLLGVIGAEYGHEIEQSKRKSADDQKKKNVVDGFGLNNYSLARHTSKALAYLLLAQPSSKLPAHTSLRRAAVDLIGRGFTVWEPYLDVSKILLGLLELCCDSDKLVPSMSYGLPLTPTADSCRTARHALSLIGTARPPAFITTMAKEVARYNALAQNAQALNVNLSHSILNKSKPEILRVVELLIVKMQNDVAELLVEVMDIILHCLDNGQLKNKGLKELFPAICKFNAVSYCTQTRRIAVGAKNGNLALYELRSSKNQTANPRTKFPELNLALALPSANSDGLSQSQANLCASANNVAEALLQGEYGKCILTLRAQIAKYAIHYSNTTAAHHFVIPAHSLAINACCFSPDGKFLASYSSGENKMCFWQTATGLFGLGNSQTRCVRTYKTKPLPENISLNILKMVSLVWITNKIVILMLSNGTEYRFSV
ncbi:WD repeat-containing protein 7 [Nymphon striatum]|nr:WD repeat-containing protein 7 [Nymphon striatum]